jgi:hypothetical protein
MLEQCMNVPFRAGLLTVEGSQACPSHAIGALTSLSEELTTNGPLCFVDPLIKRNETI